MFALIISLLALLVSISAFAQVTVFIAQQTNKPVTFVVPSDPPASEPIRIIVPESSSEPPSPTESVEDYRDHLYGVVQAAAREGVSTLRVQGNALLNNYAYQHFKTASGVIRSNRWLVKILALERDFPGLSDEKKGDFVEHAIASLPPNDVPIFLDHYCRLVINHPEFQS